jgi:hypothetical protein
MRRSTYSLFESAEQGVVKIPRQVAGGKNEDLVVASSEAVHLDE